MSGLKEFEERILREKGPEHRKAWKAACKEAWFEGKESGKFKNYRQAELLVSVDWGFLGKEMEENLARNRGREVKRQNLRDKVDEVNKKRSEQSRDEKLLKGLESLPLSTCDLPADIAWIATHPKMIVKQREGESIEIGDDDKEGAPSVVAISMLQHHICDRKAFFDLLQKLIFEEYKVDSKKKREEEEAQARKAKSNEGVVDNSLENIMRLVKNRNATV